MRNYSVHISAEMFAGHHLDHNTQADFSMQKSDINLNHINMLAPSAYVHMFTMLGLYMYLYTMLVYNLYIGGRCLYTVCRPIVGIRISFHTIGTGGLWLAIYAKTLKCYSERY